MEELIEYTILSLLFFAFFYLGMVVVTCNAKDSPRYLFVTYIFRPARDLLRKVFNTIVIFFKKSPSNLNKTIFDEDVIFNGNITVMGTMTTINTLVENRHIINKIKGAKTIKKPCKTKKQNKGQIRSK